MDNEIEFLYIGWNNSTDSDGTKHDKVWAAFKAGNAYYAAWGKRGKTVSFKKHDSSYTLDSVMRRKMKESYHEVDAFQLFSIFPHFREEVESRLLFCILANKIK